MKSEFASLCHQLRGTRESIGLPMLLPINLLEVKSTIVADRLHSCHEGLHGIKGMTGMGGKLVPRAEEQTMDDASTSVDLVIVSRRLTRLSSALTNCEYTCSMHLQLLKRLEKQNWRCVEDVKGDNEPELMMAMESLEDQIEALRSWLRGAEARSKCLHQRAQGYAQTVSKQISRRKRFR